MKMTQLWLQKPGSFLVPGLRQIIHKSDCDAEN